MDDTNALVEQRRAKLAVLREKGINPFMNKFSPDVGCGIARSQFEKGVLPEGSPVRIAGRITAYRDMGKSLFFDLRDDTGRIQVYVQKAQVGEDLMAVIQQLDLADFLG